MRHEKLRLGEEEARRLLTAAEVVHLATTRPDGAPVLRALNAVVVENWVLFHGAKAGEKSECLGRPAVVTAERTVGRIPSYFVDERLACPATTLYVSAQAKGRLVDVEDLDLKAAMLQALMEKYQPEGGYLPLRADEPEYKGQLRGVRVFGLAIEEISGKAKLAQNKPPEYVTRVLEGLWRRGAPGDVESIRQLVLAHPTLPPPAFLQGPDGTRLDVALGQRDLPEVVALLENEYWHRGTPREVIERSHLGAQAWIGLRTDDGQLLGTARAMSDGARLAHVADVIVRPGYRGRGYGRALMRCLLDHPSLRHVSVVRLGTADRQRFYESLGFVDAKTVDPGFPTTHMLRFRTAS